MGRSHHLVSLAIFACLGTLWAQDGFSQSVRPVLAQHCVTCHNEKMMTGGLNLGAFLDDAGAKASPEVWRRVLDKVTTGAMPPPSFPRLTDREQSALKSWIENSFGKAAPVSDAPARVTIRRLNRV